MKTTKHNFTITKKHFKVKGLMAGHGIIQQSVADKFRVTRMAVSRVVLGRSTSARIRAEIAIRVGMSVQQLWPPKRRRPARA